MNEYDFVNEIKNKYKVEELDSKTLEYRINGFIKACGMNLENGNITKDISSNKLEYANIKNDEENYSINFYRSFSDEFGNGFNFLGNYHDLEVSFINYYEKDRKDKITSLPFKVSIDKNYNEYSYTLDITGVFKNRVKFILSKDREKVMLPNVISFYANVCDFGMILNLVKSFVSNPETVFNIYNQIIKKRSTGFTNGDLNKGITKDDSLNEPVEGIKKYIRTLFK